MSELAGTKKRCVSRNPYSQAMQCQGFENHVGPHVYHGISWAQDAKPVMQITLTEAELHILSWALSQIPNHAVKQMYATGKIYGIEEPKRGSVIMDLYQRLMSEWERWSKNG